MEHSEKATISAFYSVPGKSQPGYRLIGISPEISRSTKDSEKNFFENLKISLDILARLPKMGTGILVAVGPSGTGTPATVSRFSRWNALPPATTLTVRSDIKP